MQVTAAGRADEALSRWQEMGEAGSTPHVAIVDHQLPDHGGDWLAKEIRAMNGGHVCRLILLSSLTGILGSGRDGTFDRVISKPVKRQVLLRTLQELLGSGVTPAGPADLTSSHLQGLRALLVDDNAVNQKLGQRLLEKLGIHVTQAWNGLEAIEHLRQHHFDVVLMDCQMPEMDGFEATRTIRRANSTVLDSTVPIIAMTANALSGDRQECLGAGMNDYIAKPIDSKRLLAVLETNCPRLKICDAGTVR